MAWPHPALSAAGAARAAASSGRRDACGSSPPAAAVASFRRGETQFSIPAPPAAPPGSSAPPGHASRPPGVARRNDAPGHYRRVVINYDIIIMTNRPVGFVPSRTPWPVGFQSVKAKKQDGLQSHRYGLTKALAFEAYGSTVTRDRLIDATAPAPWQYNPITRGAPRPDVKKPTSQRARTIIRLVAALLCSRRRSIHSRTTFPGPRGSRFR